MIICLIRHGQTDWNKKGIVQGHTDRELNNKGKLEAENVGKYLAANDSDWDLIISSPLKRAHDTAKIIKKTINNTNDIILNNKVIERFFGEYEGHIINGNTFDLVHQEKVKDLEPLKTIQNRAINAIKEIEKSFNYEKVIIVSHSHFIKALIYALDANFNFKTPLKNTSLNYLEIKNQEIKLLSYNIEPKI